MNSTEFLDIKNFDFQTPGSLTERWGSTQYMSQGFSNPITAIYEFQKLGGPSFVFVGHTGGLWFGATTGQSQGVSLTAFSATVGIRTIFPYYQADFNISTWTIGARSYPQNYKNIDNLPFLSFVATTLTISTFYHGTNVISNAALVNNMFTANGTDFLRFDGATVWPANFINPHTMAASLEIINPPFITIGIGIASFGMYQFFASYVNNRGFESEIFPVMYVDFGSTISGGSIIPASFGGSFARLFVDLYTPAAFGISYINIYSFFGATTLKDTDPSVSQDFWYPPYVFLDQKTVQGETTRVFLGASIIAGSTQPFIDKLAANVGAVPDAGLRDRLTFGMSFTPRVGGAEQLFTYDNYSPRFLSTNSNILFASGFSAVRSSVFFSDIGEPQGFNAENSFEVRTNDGDEITGQITYGPRTMIFKKNSFHQLTGDNANNLLLQEVSTVYGCLNNRSICLFENILAFLDRKGIVVYNGASPELVSQKVQPIFDRMNYSAALSTACMVHDKLRSQIMTSIPVDGATFNNITVVYDYLAKAWATYDGFVPTVLSTIEGRNNSKNVFYGTSQGIVSWFGPSFTTDNGVGATTYFKTRFFKDMGDSVTKQYRRLYLNVDADPGTTYIIPVKFFQDYGPSVVLSTTMLLGQFQDRIDFGIASKSLAFELSNVQGNSPLRVYGFTIESRLQRKV